MQVDHSHTISRQLPVPLRPFYATSILRDVLTCRVPQRIRLIGTAHTARPLR